MLFKQHSTFINRLPKYNLQMLTHFSVLFNYNPNYTKLKTFDCLCFPWLKPYTNNKLEPQLEPCIFLGYSLTQSAYICYNFKTHKIYDSRHVQFVENIFPFSSNNCLTCWPYTYPNSKCCTFSFQSSNREIPCTLKFKIANIHSPKFGYCTPTN